MTVEKVEEPFWVEDIMRDIFFSLMETVVKRAVELKGVKLTEDIIIEIPVHPRFTDSTVPTFIGVLTRDKRIVIGRVLTKDGEEVVHNQQAIDVVDRTLDHWRTLCHGRVYFTNTPDSPQYKILEYHSIILD